MVDETNNNKGQELTDEEAIMKIAQAMKDNNTSIPDDKHNVHTFLFNVIQAEDIDRVSKVGNLRDDKDMNELGNPAWNVRGALAMATDSDLLMNNNFFKEYFEASANQTLSTSLSREGFIIKQATTQTKQVADVTRRRKINKGMFGSKKIEESGGDTTQPVTTQV